jgi:hypothetical protein
MDELVGVIATKEQRGRITLATYEGTEWYAMDWSTKVERFPWEARAVELLGLRKGSTVLLGAAGGGRELEALARDGVRVLAFEPTDLFTTAVTLAANHEGARVWQADYADLVRAANTGDGPLRDVASETIDAVILGWGSLGHVLDPADQLALLRATRQLAPNAPLLCSYLGEANESNGRRARVRRQLRRLRPTLEPRLRFRADVGFFSAFRPTDVAGLAAQSGYRVELEEWDDFPHAILQPDP